MARWLQEAQSLFGHAPNGSSHFAAVCRTAPLAARRSVTPPAYAGCMKMAKCWAVCLSLVCTWQAPAWALGPGDIMFTAYNADEDGWSIVALVDLAPQTTIHFSDNNRVADGFASGEGYLRWDVGDDTIAAGTVVRFSAIDSATSLGVSQGQLQRLQVAGSTAPNLSQTADTLYAYLATDPTRPQVFLAAVSNEGLLAAVGSVAGTRLAVGSSAVSLPTGVDYAEYSGLRSGAATPQALRQWLGASSTWASQDAGTFVAMAPSVQAFEVTPVPEPAAWWLAALGAGVLRLWRGRRPVPRQGQHSWPQPKSI